LKRVRITHNLIKKLINSEEILTFSYFVKLKYLYSNSTIYNFSLRKAAKLIGVSPNSIKFHLKKMEEMEIIKIVKNKKGGKNITFSSIEKISKKYGVNHNNKCGSIIFRDSENVQDIKTRFYSKVLINNLNKQRYTIKGKSNSLMRKRDQLNKLNKSGVNPDFLQRSIASERIIFDTFICCDTIGDMLDKTKMTGYNQLKKMVSMGLLNIKKKQMKVLENCKKEDFENLCKNGNLIKGKHFYSIKDSSIFKNVGFSIEVL
jgi:DNA-binding MarR family transcriptional regulator